MKTYKLLGFLFTFFLIYCSCKDPCESVNCNNGVCVEGSCNCNFGWKGEDCSIMRATQFKGFFEGTMNCAVASDTVVLKVENVQNSLTDLKMHTVGMIFSYSIISISFDEYIMSAKIDSSFTKFEITPLPVTYKIPNTTQEFKFVLSGSGTMKNETEIDLNLKIDPEQTIIPDIDCQGVLKK